MSPRAAWRLEALGFAQVYDYVDGKVDCVGHGLPTEGEGPHYAVAGEVVSTDVATCSLDESLSQVRKRVQDSDYNFCVVVNDARVVLGRVRKEALGQAGGVASDVMEAGPTTVRPREPLASLVERMKKRGPPTSS
jgi:hypothetical protein